MSVYAGPNFVEDGLLLALDAGNSRSFSPNVFPGALDFYTWYTSIKGNSTAVSCTLSQDLSTPKSPANGIPLRMDVTGNDPAIPSYNSSPWNVSAVSNGQTWTLSVYVKGSVATTAQMFLFGADNSGVSLVGGNWIGIASTIFNITTEWTRQQLSITFNNASVAYIHLRLDGPDSGGVGQTIWWDGIQLERNSSPTPFNPRVNTNGTNFWDISGNSNNRTLVNGPTFLNENNGVISFDGVDDYTTISIPSDTGTISFWYYYNINTASKLIMGNSSSMLFCAGAGGGAHWYNHTPDYSFYYFWGNVSQWLNIALVYGSTTDNKMYVNGNLAYSSNSYSLTKGTVYNVAGNYYNPQNCKFSNINVYNRALSPAEIRQNFNALRGRFRL